MQTIGDGQTVETVRLIFRKSNFRSYGTFNRVIWEKFQTVRLIQTVRIIESTEYVMASMCLSYFQALLIQCTAP